MTRFVVGYDGDSEAGDALALASRLGDALDAEVIVAFAQPASRDEAAWRTRADEVLSAAAAALGSRPHDVRPLLAAHPAEALADLAAAEAADMIVIGSTERGSLGRVYPGSTATALFAAAPCAVAVAPRGLAEGVPHRLRTVGVAYRNEYSDSRPALARATELADVLGARLKVITEEAEGADAARALLRDAEHVDLLVLGSRRLPAPWAALASSVSSSIATAPPCPVIIVPGPAQARAG